MEYKLTKLEYELIKSYIDRGYHYMHKTKNAIVFSVFPIKEEKIDRLNSGVAQSMFNDIDYFTDYSLEEILENIYLIKN